MEQYFDFVCISLNHRRNDRAKSSQNLFQKLNISNLVNWWVVDKYPSDGIYGCFESHVSIWNCSEFTKPYLCIFEDDLESNEENSICFKQALKYAYSNMPHNFDILNLEPKLGFTHKYLHFVI